MFLLTTLGLQAFYPSHASRFHGFLEVMEMGIPYMVDDGDINLSVLGNLSHKVRGMLSDLMVLYFTIRASHGQIDLDTEMGDALHHMFDNVRLAMYIAFRLYNSVRDYCVLANYERRLPRLPHHSHEENWLYDNYVAWRELMEESYSGASAAVSVMRHSKLDAQDVQCICFSRSRLERIMSNAQFGDMPVRHMLRPINYSTAVYPMVRRLVALELRMRMNDKGELGETDVAPWHTEDSFVIPPSAATFLLARRVGEHV